MKQVTSKTLKRQRHRFGLSQYLLSKMSGVSRFKITCFECGYVELTDLEKAKLSKALSYAPKGV